MSAKAEAKAAAALRELGATLKASATAPKLHTLQLFITSTSSASMRMNHHDEDELELNISWRRSRPWSRMQMDGSKIKKIKSSQVSPRV